MIASRLLLAALIVPAALLLALGGRRLLHYTPDAATQLHEITCALTGDGNVVALDATIAWHTQHGTDDGGHIEPALRALFENAAITAAASHTLAELLAPPHETTLREIPALLDDKLAYLATHGAGLGIVVTRADIAAALPPEMQSAADTAEDRARHAEAGLANTRAQAAQRLQQTDRDRDRIFGNAHAEAAERLAAARSSTATLIALEARLNQSNRPALLADLYRERIAAILRQAGSVSTVDPKSVSKVIIPDALP